MNARGFTLLELLVAVAIASIVVLALGQLYVSAAYWGRLDYSLTYMQRQGTRVLDEVGQRIREGADLRCSPAACDQVGGDTLAACGVDPSLQVTVPGTGVYCFRLNAEGGNQLIEVHPGGGTLNMLLDSLAPLTVSGCPNDAMFSVVHPGGDPGVDPNQVDICFQLNTTSTPPESIMFRASFAKRN